MNLKRRIKKLENVSERISETARRERIAQMSDEELEAASAFYARKFPELSARSKAFFASLSDAELNALYSGNLGAVSAQTRRGYAELIKL